MAFQVEYQRKAMYESVGAGITIEAILRHGNLETACQAKVDTGSQVCLFGRTFADALDIDVESGYREVFSTLAGGIVAYAHEVELETLGLRFPIVRLFCRELCRPQEFIGTTRLAATGDAWGERLRQ